MTVAHTYTVAFEGIDAREVDVQVHIGDGKNGVFNIVGLADKAVGERGQGFDGFGQHHQQHAALGAAGAAQQALATGSGKASSSPYSDASPCVKKVSQRTPAVSVTQDLSDFA